MERFWTVVALCLALTGLACFAQEPAYKGFPELISKSYHVDVETTTIGSNKSQFIREYHNREDNTGYMEMFVEGMTSHLYYFQETDEEVTILDNTCSISKLSEKGAAFDGKTVYAGPSASLHELPPSVMRYVGPKAVRGVTTNHFQGTHNEMLYDVYVRTSDWTENDVKGEVPVRVEIVHQHGVDHNIYDFYNFEPYKPKIGEMNLKTGIGCEGKKNPSSKKLPTIPNQISFQYEIYYQTRGSPEQHVTVNKIWYDGTNKVARVELFQNTATTRAEIHDFNSGIMYSFDKEGTCKIDHLSKSYFSLTMEDREIETMKTPAQMLELIGNFYYVGQAVMRGVACDIWESVRTNVTIEGLSYDRLVTTFYFTSLQWFSAGAQLDKFVPLRRDIAGSTSDSSNEVWTPELHSVNYFDFVEEDRLDETFLWNFDIRECFITKTYLDLLFISDKNVSEETFWQYHDSLLETIWEKLYTLPRISPLRIPKPQIGFLEDGSIHVVALLLPAPGAIASFVDSRAYVPGSAMRHVVRKPTQEDCAQECLNDPNCLTFIYCDHECFFSSSNKPKDWGSPMAKRNCQRYSKADDNISVTFVNNSEVVRVLQNEVENGALVLKVADKERPATFKAVRINTDASPFNAQHSSGLYQVAFQEKVLSLKEDTTMRAVMLDGKNEITSVQQCYRNCITESGTECASFSYCPTTKDCRLSSLYILDDEQASKSLEMESRCTVYTRSYINMYEKFPGTVSRVGGDITKDNVPDEDQCAHLCKHDKLVRCRGFEYCPGTKHCVLHEKHFLDIRPEDIINGTEACSHYAQKFSSDYWEGAKGEMDDPNSITITLISFEDCAKQCSLDPAGRCKSFNFCPADDGPDRKCVLNSRSVYDLGKDMKLKESKDCYFYFQQDHVNDFIHYNQKQALAAPAKGYTSGGLGGLLFGMLILGLVLGAAGFTAFNYFRSRRGGANNSTVRFMRHEDNS